MKPQKKLKVFEYSLICLLLITTTLTILLGVKAERLLDDTNLTWMDYIQDVEVKEKTLSQIRKNFGYGGFIHHFKNYVLRQDDFYLNELRDSQRQLLEATNKYQTLSLNSDEKYALKRLLIVIDKYIANIPLAIQARNEHWTQEQTDRLVLVDDYPAIDALQVLEENWLKQYQQDLTMLHGSYQQGESLAGTALLTTILLIAVIGLSIWFIERLTTEIKKRHEKESQLHLSQAAIEASSNGISVVDDEGKIIFVNPGFEKITGYSAKDVIGNSPRILSSGRHDVAFYKQMWDKIKTEGRWTGEVWNRHKNGELYLEGLDIIKFPQSLFNNGRYLSIFSDITLQKKEESLKAFQATHDPLTKLPNRHLLFDRLSNELLNCTRTQSSVALLFIDLDKFKEINDNLGHLTGDQVLIDVSQRITHSLRQTDIVCRYGGDEFIVIVPNIHSDHDWQRLAEALLINLRKPYSVGDDRLELSASIGITIHSHTDEANAEELVRKADKAMYAAKSAGKNRYALAEQLDVDDLLLV